MQDSFFMLSFVICFVRILGIKVLVTKKKKKGHLPSAFKVSGPGLGAGDKKGNQD